MQTPPIVTPEEWEAARAELLVKEMISWRRPSNWALSTTR